MDHHPRAFQELKLKRYEGFIMGCDFSTMKKEATSSFETFVISTRLNGAISQTIVFFIIPP
jgi:hypothetical protein